MSGINGMPGSVHSVFRECVRWKAVGFTIYTVACAGLPPMLLVSPSMSMGWAIAFVTAVVCAGLMRFAVADVVFELSGHLAQLAVYAATQAVALAVAALAILNCTHGKPAGSAWTSVAWAAFAFAGVSMTPSWLPLSFPIISRRRPFAIKAGIVSWLRQAVVTGVALSTSWPLVHGLILFLGQPSLGARLLWDLAVAATSREQLCLTAAVTLATCAVGVSRRIADLVLTEQPLDNVFAAPGALTDAIRGSQSPLLRAHALRHIPHAVRDVPRFKKLVQQGPELQELCDACISVLENFVRVLKGGGGKPRASGAVGSTGKSSSFASGKPGPEAYRRTGVSFKHEPNSATKHTTTPSTQQSAMPAWRSKWSQYGTVWHNGLWDMTSRALPSLVLPRDLQRTHDLFGGSNGIAAIAAAQDLVCLCQAAKDAQPMAVQSCVRAVLEVCLEALRAIESHTSSPDFVLPRAHKALQGHKCIRKQVFAATIGLESSICQLATYLPGEVQLARTELSQDNAMVLQKRILR